MAVPPTWHVGNFKLLPGPHIYEEHIRLHFQQLMQLHQNPSQVSMTLSYLSSYHIICITEGNSTWPPCY